MQNNEPEKLLLFLLCLLFTPYGYVAKVIDLTHPVGEDTIQWPTASSFHVSNKFAAMVEDAGYWYESRDFSQAEHSGTHTDAPAHFFKDRWHTADIPLDRLIAPGVKIDIEERANNDPDTMLMIQDLIDWEEKYGDIPEKSIVIVHTGRGAMYSEKQRYFGRPDDVTNEKDVENLHFPGISAEAATWLTMKRNVVGVAIDTPSTDRGQSKKFLTHQVLGKHNVWGLENLANSDKLPSRGFTVYNMVHKLEGGSGGPTRVVAVLDHDVATGVAHYCFHKRIWLQYFAYYLLFMYFMSM